MNANGNCTFQTFWFITSYTDQIIQVLSQSWTSATAGHCQKTNKQQSACLPQADEHCRHMRISRVVTSWLETSFSMLSCNTFRCSGRQAFSHPQQRQPVRTLQTILSANSLKSGCRNKAWQHSERLMESEKNIQNNYWCMFIHIKSGKLVNYVHSGINLETWIPPVSTVDGDQTESLC